jgi:hypothetical protein
MTFNVAVGVCRLSINATVLAINAPKQVVEKLRNELKQLYVVRSRPSWLLPSLDRPVRWVELPSYTKLVYELSISVLSRKVDYVVAVVGDVDGVSRQLYHVYHHAVLGKALEISGVRVWASPLYPITVIDLTAAPRPWPEKVPFEEMGVKVNPYAEVYAWSPPRQVADYVRDMVRRVIAYHVVGSNSWWPKGLSYPTSISVKLVVLLPDSPWPRALQVVGSYFLSSYVLNALRSVYPLGGLSFELVVDKVDRYPLLKKALSSLKIDRDGYAIVVFEDVADAIKDIVRLYGGQVDGGEWVYVFVLLVLDRPAKLYIRSINEYATAVSVGDYGFGVFPGRDERLLRGGLAVAVAHELGHSLGEDHVFEGPNGIDWRMDFAGTVMSYYDPVAAAIAASPVYQGAVWKPILVRSLARILVTLYTEGFVEAETLVRLISSLYASPESVIATVKKYVAGTPTQEVSTMTVTFTKVLTKVRTATELKATTVTVYREAVKTVTVGEVELRTTTIVKYVATRSVGESLASALALTFAILALALALRSRRSVHFYR